MNELHQLYPSIATLPAQLRDEVLAQHATPMDVPAHTSLFEAHQPCQGFPLLLSGEVRVARGAPGGRQLELYRVVPGEICVASTASLFGHAPLAAHGHTTCDTRMLVLSPTGFERWLADATFRQFALGVFAERLTDLMALAEAVAFQRLDQRLAAALLGHGSTLHHTHQALADELGTVREIITRLLRRFERAGWLRLGREQIEVLAPSALRRVAAGESTE